MYKSLQDEHLWCGTEIWSRICPSLAVRRNPSRTWSQRIWWSDVARYADDSDISESGVMTVARHRYKVWGYSNSKWAFPRPAPFRRISNNQSHIWRHQLPLIIPVASGVVQNFSPGGHGRRRTGSEVRGDKVIQKWKPSGVRSAKFACIRKLQGGTCPSAPCLTKPLPLAKIMVILWAAFLHYFAASAHKIQFTTWRW